MNIYYLKRIRKRYQCIYVRPENFWTTRDVRTNEVKHHEHIYALMLWWMEDRLPNWKIMRWLNNGQHRANLRLIRILKNALTSKQSSNE